MPEEDMAESASSSMEEMNYQSDDNTSDNQSEGIHRVEESKRSNAAYFSHNTQQPSRLSMKLANFEERYQSLASSIVLPSARANNYNSVPR